MKFENRVAVVTGGAGGIGHVLCRKFCEAGVSVALADLTLDAAEKAAAAIRKDGGNIRSYAMNVTDNASVNAAAGQIFADFGHVDILVNNAGKWPCRVFSELSEEEWLSVIDLNLNGTFRVIRAFLNPMIEAGYGRIINLGSIAGEVGLPRYSAYSASKGGVIMLTKTLAMELAQKNITVNSVSPGMVSDVDGETRPTKFTWIGRSGSREEISDLIMFLAADDAAFITGVDYTIDGGRILGPRFCDM